MQLQARLRLATITVAAKYSNPLPLSLYLSLSRPLLEFARRYCRGRRQICTLKHSASSKVPYGAGQHGSTLALNTLTGNRSSQFSNAQHKQKGTHARAPRTNSALLHKPDRTHRVATLTSLPLHTDGNEFARSPAQPETPPPKTPKMFSVEGHHCTGCVFRHGCMGCALATVVYC